MLFLMLQRVSSRVSGFLWPRRVYGESSKLLLSKVSKLVCMSFCVAGVALPDILTCLQTCRKTFMCDRRNTFARFSAEELNFVAGAALQTCRVACSTLYTPHSRLNTHTPHLHSTLYISTLTHCTLHSTLYTPHTTFHTLHSTLYTPNFTLDTFHSHTLHSTLHTPHSTLHTPHSTLHTLHCTLHTLHFTLTLHTLHSTLYTLHFPLHTLHSTLNTPHFTL